MSLIGLFTFLLVGFYFVLVLVAGSAVNQDAKRRDDLFLGLPPAWWAAVTILTLGVGLIFYWLVHHSALRGSGFGGR